MNRDRRATAASQPLGPQFFQGSADPSRRMLLARGTELEEIASRSRRAADGHQLLDYCRRGRKRRQESDGTTSIRDLQRLTGHDASEVDTQALSQLPHADRGLSSLHVAHRSTWPDGPA